MNNYFLIFFILTIFKNLDSGAKKNLNTASQEKHISCVKEFNIDSIQYLCYSRKDNKFPYLYYNPHIVKGNVKYKIEGIDSCLGTGFFNISTTKKYLTLYKIEFSLLENKKVKYLEKYALLIVDISNSMVIFELYGADCDGFWSAHDEWINKDSAVVFSGN